MQERTFIMGRLGFLAENRKKLVEFESTGIRILLFVCLYYCDSFIAFKLYRFNDLWKLKSENAA